MDLYLAARWAHIGLGTAGFVLGMLAIAAPKFGRASFLHRYAGRAYAIVMLGMSLLSVPLAARLGSIPLLVIGLLTLAAVGLGWRAIRVVAGGGSPRNRFRRHVILMGASYIAAWTAFLMTNPLLATGSSWDGSIHRYGPTVVGSVLIFWYLRFRLPARLGLSPARGTPPSALPPPAESGG